MIEPIRILHVLGCLDRGGAETMVMNLYRNIDRNKIQFDFAICTDNRCDYSDEVESLGGRIYSFPRFSLRNAIKYSKCWYEFFDEHKEYKIIHGHLRSTASIYLGIARRYGLTTIAHSHSTSSGTHISAIAKNFLQLPIRFIANYLFACSNSAGIWLFGRSACSKENYFILYNAINAKEHVYNAETRLRIRKELQVEDKFVIGHVGAFKHVKNHEFIIRVFNEVHKKYNKSILLLVGGGKLKSKIENKVDELGLTECVIFIGVSSKIADLMQAMDVFLFPSLYEGIPVTIIEAQASGLPCVVSDTISREVSVTNLVEFVPLSYTAEKWAQSLLNYANDYLRCNMYNEINDAKYDIRTSSRWIQEFYLRLAENR